MVRSNNLVQLLIASITALLLVMGTQLAYSQGLVMRKQASLATFRDSALISYQEALAFVQNGNYQAVRLKIQEAVSLWQQQGENDRAVEAILDVAYNLKQARQWPEALQYCHEILMFKSSSEQRKVVARIYIAQIYTELYQFDLALMYYERALMRAREIRDLSAQRTALIGQALIYIERNMMDRALVYLKEAQTSAVQEKNLKDEAQVCHLTSQIYFLQGTLLKARSTLEQSLTIYRRIEDVEGEVKSLCSLSEVSLRLGDPQIALFQAQHGASLTDKLKSQATSRSDWLKYRELRWPTMLMLARAQRALQQNDVAAKSYFRAIAEIEALRISYPSDSPRIAFMEDQQAPYEELIDLLIEQGNIEAAFLTVESRRSRNALDLLTESLVSKKRMRSTTEKEIPLLSEDRSNPQDRLRSEVLFNNKRVVQESEVRDRQLRQEELNLRIKLSRSINSVRPSSLKEVQRTILKPDELLLEFSLGENRSFVWLISPEEVRLTVLPGRKVIENTITQYLKIISTKPNALYLERDLAEQTKFASQLFDLLLRPVSDKLATTKRLIIVPNGLLHYLPFESLISNGKYLIENYVISYVPSASVLGVLRKRMANRDRQFQMDLLAIGDPTDSLTFKKNGQNKGSDNYLAERGSLGDLRFAPLPRTREEVLLISKLFEPERVRIYLGNQANEAAIKSELGHKYRILHFATHNLISEQNSGKSGILLSHSENSEDDGILDISEITELNLESELVVLSACQTARGRIVQGEGVMGINLAFLLAGTDSVLSSLWNVGDITTSQLMKLFYKYRANAPSNAEALRQATLQSVRSSGLMKHPYYWSPFVITGSS